MLKLRPRQKQETTIEKLGLTNDLKIQPGKGDYNHIIVEKDIIKEKIQIPSFEPVKLIETREIEESEQAMVQRHKRLEMTEKRIKARDREMLLHKLYVERDIKPDGYYSTLELKGNDVGEYIPAPVKYKPRKIKKRLKLKGIFASRIKPIYKLPKLILKFKVEDQPNKCILLEPQKEQLQKRRSNRSSLAFGYPLPRISKLDFEDSPELYNLIKQHV
ncbi:hypothetical protein HDV01_002205 [Terramyces sp. JEL0728]|nr:hypothetical protein HDV01_002205 [Terramyces sp. JEL0728]